MPRLRRRRKERKSDLEKSLARFLADGSRKFWTHDRSRFVAIRTGEHQASVRDKQTGQIVLAALRRKAARQSELLQGRQFITAEEFLDQAQRDASEISHG